MGDVVSVFIVVIVLVLAVVVVLAVVLSRRERQRTQRIREWAARHGWGIVNRPDVAWTSRLPGGQRRGVALLVHGVVRGWQVCVAEYSYQTEGMSNPDGSRSTTTHNLIVMAVRLARPYPPIEVQFRGAFSRFGRALFGDGDTATGNDAFDRRFRVRTRHPELVRSVLGPALITEHLTGRAPVWSLAGYDLLTWRDGWIKEPEHVPGLVAPLTLVADLLGNAP